MTKSQKVAALFACALSMALGAGCAADTDSSDDTNAALAETPADCTPDGKIDAGTDAGPTDAPDAGPDGGAEDELRVKVTNVTASGAGCSVGTWNYVPTDDGKAFALGFDSYAISLESENKSLKQLACTLTLTLKTAKDQSVGLRSVAFSGDATLVPGAKGAFLVDIAYTGIGVDARYKTGTHNATTSGPFSYEYVPETVYWSPCDITSRLQLRTRLTLETPGGAGKSELRLLKFAGLSFATRACPSTSTDDAGTSP